MGDDAEAPPGAASKREEEAKTEACEGHDEDAMVGEWRQVENVVTVLRSLAGGLRMVADPAQPSLELVRLRAAGRWRAQRASGEAVYELSQGARDTMEVRKGTRALKIFRIARTRTLIGDWVHPTGKTISVLEAGGGGGLELHADGRTPLRLLRRKIMEWEAQRDRGYGDESVYALEHTEGSQRIVVRRPEGLEDPRAPPLEFARVGSGGASSSAASASIGRSLQPPAAQRSRRPLLLLPPQGSNCRSRSPPRRRRSASPSGSSHEADLHRFCTENELSERAVAALRSVGRREQRHVMGLDGGRNSFMLSGNVRDPNAVVMSRLKRLQQEPLGSNSLGRGGASRSRSPWRGRSRSSSAGGGRKRSGSGGR